MNETGLLAFAILVISPAFASATLKLIVDASNACLREVDQVKLTDNFVAQKPPTGKWRLAEMDEISGRGWAKLEAGLLVGQIRFHLGDRSRFSARKWKTTETT